MHSILSDEVPSDRGELKLKGELTCGLFFRRRPNSHEAGPRVRRRSEHIGMDRVPRQLLGHLKGACAHRPGSHGQVAMVSATPL